MDMMAVSSASRSQTIQAGAVALLLVALTSIAFHSDAVLLLQRWLRDDNYSHGLLLMPITLYLIFTALRTQQPQSKPSLPLLLCVAGIGAIMLLGSLASVAVTFQWLLPPLVGAVLMSIYGARAMPALAFPVLFLYFSLPVWDSLSPVLQTLTTVAVERMLYATGVSALIDGNFVTVSAGLFEIAEGCSGLRFFMISAAVAALYGYWYLQGWRRQLSFVAVAIVLAIVGNWVRVYIVIRMGIHLGIEHPYVADHGAVGWVIFAVTMGVLFGFSGRWEAQGTRPAQAVLSQRSLSLTTIFLPFGLIGMLFMATLGAQYYAAQGDELQVAAPGNFFVTARRGAVCGDWQTDIVGAQQTLRGIVESENDACLDIAWFDRQSAGHELVNAKHRLYGRNARRNTQAQIPASTQGIHATLLTSVAGRPLLVAHQLRVGGRIVRDGAAAKRQQIMSLFEQRTDAMLVAVAVRCDQQCTRQMASGKLPAALQAMPVFSPQVSLTASDAANIEVQ